MTLKRRTIALAALALLCLPAVGANDLDGRIVGAALVEGQAYDKLSYLCDRIGHRLSGSKALEHAVAWAAEEFRRDGIEHVWTEKVMVPHWVRGEAAAKIVAPVQRSMVLTALGGSVGTPPEGLTAEVVMVTSFEELEALGAAVAGKIVLFNRPIEAGFASERGYGSAVGLRVDGPSRAAALGAVGTLIRSLGTADFRLPHTGTLRYADDQPRVPAAAISAEDAELIRRLLAAGDTVRVELKLGCRTLPDAESANVLAEIRGRELPGEVVLIGAHLDSWDVGSGAIDDGAGCAIVMETLRLLQAHGWVPRRTIRAVLFTNEENGLRGGKAYADLHADELAHHVAAIESDSGGATPIGFGVSAGPGAVEALQEIVRPLSIIGADKVRARGGGADIGPMKVDGVPMIGLMQESLHYFDYHHTEADTPDKVDPHDLDRNVAALALVAYRLAEMDAPLARLEPGTEVDDD